MLKKTLTTVILAAMATASLCAKDIKGTVRDTEGNAVAGVVVSDGLNTVVTDAKGRFKMDADQDSIGRFIHHPDSFLQIRHFFLSNSTAIGIYRNIRPSDHIGIITQQMQ